MTNDQLEAIGELKAKWLSDHGAKFSDVMIGEDNEQYIITGEFDEEVLTLPVFTEMDADAWLDLNPTD